MPKSIEVTLSLMSPVGNFAGLFVEEAEGFGRIPYLAFELVEPDDRTSIWFPPRWNS